MGWCLFFFNGTSTVASCLQVLLLALFKGAHRVAYLIRCSINCLSIYLQRYYQDLYVSKAEKSGILKPFEGWFFYEMWELLRRKRRGIVVEMTWV